MAASGILGTGLPPVDQYDVNKYILSPIYKGEDYMSYMDILPNIKGTTKIDHFGSAEKGTLGFNEGAFAATNLSNMSAVTISPARMEFEQEFRGAQLFGKIKGQLLKGNFEFDNIEGTQVKQILLELIGKGVQSDFNRQLWLGSTADTDASVGYAQDDHYKEYDGLFLTAHKAMVTSYSQNILTAGSTSGWSPSGSTTFNKDDAYEILADMYETAAPALLEQPDLVYFVSGEVADRYAEHLEAQGSYMAFQQLRDGGRLAFRGIPIIVRRDWDKWVKADNATNDQGKINGSHTDGNNSATATKNTPRAMLTCRNAFVVGTDWSSTAVEQWYSQDAKAYRFRVSYMIGCALTDPNLAVIYTPVGMVV